MTQLGFYFDASACIGCKACSIACKDRSDLEVGRQWRRVYEVAGGSFEKIDNVLYPNVTIYYLSIACNHCENPPCVDVCPSKAIIKRDDGVVLLDADKCIGCRYCEWTCPYSAMQFDTASGLMSKCDFCSDLIDAGEAPVCVTSCPQRCLDFGPVNELRAKYGGNVTVAPLPDPGKLEPALVVRPHSAASSRLSEGFRMRIINEEEV